MAILNREEYLKRLEDFFREDSSDEAISFIEDMTDTYTDLNDRIQTGDEDWKRRYEENDAAWRKRYRSRFFSGGTNNPYDPNYGDKDDTEVLDAEDITVDDLFERMDN